MKKKHQVQGWFIQAEEMVSVENCNEKLENFLEVICYEIYFSASLVEDIDEAVLIWYASLYAFECTVVRI